MKRIPHELIVCGIMGQQGYSQDTCALVVLIQLSSTVNISITARLWRVVGNQVEETPVSFVCLWLLYFIQLIRTRRHICHIYTHTQTHLAHLYVFVFMCMLHRHCLTSTQQFWTCLTYLCVYVFMCMLHRHDSTLTQQFFEHNHKTISKYHFIFKQ